MSILATIGIGIVAMLIAGLIVKPLLGFGGGFITAVIVSIALVALYARMAGDRSGRLAR
jgi:membrane protein implicated in regulation of membrane protease activity